MRYAIVIERLGSSFGAYVPDLPGCVAVGQSEAQARVLITEAIALHVEALRADGESVPAPSVQVGYVEVVARA